LPISLLLKLACRASDESDVTNKDIGRWLVSGALVTGLLEITSGFSQGPDALPQPGDSAGLATLEAGAMAGDASAQTRLADHCLSVGDFAKAVDWYRKAATHGELEAQLSLASCYLAGQGVEKNPLEAARWLRAAAARLEQGQPAPKVTAAAPPLPTAAPLRLSPRESSAAPAANPSANGRSSSRIQRVLTVQVLHPELQEPAQPPQLLKATP